MRPNIFISHRHEDRPIADVLREHLMLWDSKATYDIFQSSEPGAGVAPSIGKGIKDDLVLKLRETRLLILVLTRANVDWSWCMWECGLALDPAGSDTRIVVLECAGYSPPFFKQYFRVQLTSDEVKKFTHVFHRSDLFMTDLPAFDPDIPTEVIDMRARLLYEKLLECIPRAWTHSATPRKDLQFDESSRVFLCHSSSDKPAVRTLYRRLREDGFKPWLDEEDLLGGQKWKDEIPKVIRTSAVVLVCLSHNCVTKAGYVQREIKIALDVLYEQPEGRVFVIPIKLEDCEIPDRLKDLHCLNYFDKSGHDRLQQSIRSALRAAIGDLSKR